MMKKLIFKINQDSDSWLTIKNIFLFLKDNNKEINKKMKIFLLKKSRNKCDLKFLISFN